VAICCRKKPVIVLFIALVQLALCYSITANASPLYTSLHIERVAGSEACPDERAVFSAVARLFPETPLERSLPDSSVVASASVTIRPVLSGHEAYVTVLLPRPGERTLYVKNSDCIGLDEALAVSLVLLLDPEAEKRQSPLKETELTPSRPVALPPERPATPTGPSNRAKLKQVPQLSDTAPHPTHRLPHEHAQKHINLYVQANALATLGLLAKSAEGLDVGFNVSLTSGIGWTVQGLYLRAQPVKHAPGSVQLSLWGALTGPCYHPRIFGSDLRNWTLNTCLLLGVGAQNAVSAGYRQNDSADRPWVVLGPSLSLEKALTQRLSGALSLGFFGHLRREGFRVKGEGTVVEAPTAGALVQLGLKFGGIIF
jgi:hypothetical protein